MNGTWFDTQAGEVLVGTAAVEQRLEQSGPQIVVPLAHLVQAEHFPYKTGDFELRDTSSWCPEDYIAYGKWALTMVARDGEPQPIKRQHFRRLRVLGLGPPIVRLGGNDNFRAYKDLIGAPLEGDVGRYRGRFRDVPLEDIVACARKVTEELGHKLTQSTYRDAVRRGALPSDKILYNVVGGIRRLNDLIGYPDIASWQEEDYVDFGMDFLEVNGTDLFIPAAFDIIGKRQRGPWTRQVLKAFGKWSKYKHEVLCLWREQVDGPKERLTGYRTRIAAGRLPEEYANLPDDILLRTVARYRVIEAVAPNMPPVAKKKLAVMQTGVSLVRRLQALHRHADEAHVEMTALSLGVFDDIWPATKRTPRPHIQVEQEEIIAFNAVRCAQAQVRREEKQKLYVPA